MMSLVKKYSINLSLESEVSCSVSSLFRESNKHLITHINHEEKGGGNFAHEIGFEQEFNTPPCYMTSLLSLDQMYGPPD